MAAEAKAVFIDTAVVMYAGGAAHPLREPSRAVLDMVGEGTLRGVSSAEVVQEILHRFGVPDRRELGARMARAALDLFAPVVPVTHDVMARAVELLSQYPQLSSRDIVHAATCLHESIPVIVTPDRGFDAVRKLRRIDPADTPSLHALCR